jgi:tetratricopeptide (TPR) repeat protein
MANAANALGILYRKLHRAEEELEVYERVVDAGYARAVTYHNLGTSLGRGGNYPAAMQMFRKAVELNPMFAPAHSELGIALIAINQISEGIEHFRKSLEINPENLMVQENLKLVLEMQAKQKRRRR